MQKKKRKSNWMKGFILPEPATDLEKSQSEARMTIREMAIKKRKLREVKN